MLRAASSLPGDTPASAASTWRVKKGTTPKTSGMIAPLTPIAVPSTVRVKGMRKISRMTNGMERKTLTNTSSTR